MIERNLKHRKLKERALLLSSFSGVAVSLLVLGILLGGLVATAAPFLSTKLFTNFSEPLNRPESGFAASIMGTLWLVGLTLAFSIPLGVGAGIYLEEYAPRNRLTRLFEAGVENLAGVPSVVFGLLGLAVFSRVFGLGNTILAGALTLTILVFPYVVINTQEAIRAVPSSLREGSLALGATKWQTIRKQTLPVAAPGLLTGAILAASRAMGETAPLIVIGAVGLITFHPWGPDAPLTALPVQIYGYVLRPDEVSHGLAAAGMVVLLFILFAFNAIAIVMRQRLQKAREGI